MRTLTLALALTLGLGLFANEAKAQYVRFGVGTGYNTYYAPGYVVGGYNYPGYYGVPYGRVYSPYNRGYYGSGVSVVTPGFAFSYGTPNYGYGYYPRYGYGYRGYRGYRGWR